MDIEKVIDRVQKLLKVATGDANENESQTAARMAAKMMEKHNLEMHDVIVEELHDGNVIDSPVVGWGLTNWPGWLETMFSSIAKTFDCHGNKKSYWDEETYSNGWKLQVYGYKDDVKIVQWLFSFCYAEANRGADEYWEQFGEMYRHAGIHARAAKRDYRIGFSEGVMATLQDIRLKKKPISSGKELVVLKEQAIQDKYGDFGYKQTEGPDSVLPSYQDGHDHGSSLNLEAKPIEHESA